MPSFIHPSDNFDRPSRPTPANGAPLSVRIRSGTPYSRIAASQTAVPRQNYDRLSNQVHKPGIQLGSFTCKAGLMLRPLRLILVLYSRFFHSRRDLLLENLALRQQLGVLQRRHPQPRFGISDKFFWVILRRLWPGWNRALILIQPETVVRWHRVGFK